MTCQFPLSPFGATSLQYYSQEVDVIELDSVPWTKADDFYTSYFAAVGGAGMARAQPDALWDSLTGGGINQHNPPFRIRINGTLRMSSDAREMVRRFETLVHEAEQEGHKVQIESLP